MAVKTITVTESAYESITRLKQQDESFSDLFLRIGRPHMTARDLLGKAKLSPEDSAEFRRRVREVHEGLGKGLEEHIEYVRSRLKRTH
ncbi:antitoxin VapB family protein [Candidatus Woesearchaeota archaeon]|nr:antitoxin VapB family protein [Candidatus Woesearchaeota archaeon]